VDFFALIQSRRMPAPWPGLVYGNNQQARSSRTDKE
jgi:hypothetical protein